MIAHLARSVGDTQTAVRIGKQAIARGQNLVYYSLSGARAARPTSRCGKPPEAALLFGLARQETEFNSDTVSGAGARGILQVMKVHGEPRLPRLQDQVRHERLLVDGSYNTMIASAYIADRIAEFAGSYVLSIASYNAGPGRARQWISEFGDPRKAKRRPDRLDRAHPHRGDARYVGKVLSNIQIYRARLGDEATALQLDQDLARAREASLSPRGTRRPTPTRRSPSDEQPASIAFLKRPDARRASTTHWRSGEFMTSEAATFEDIFFTARDGLRLHARRYPRLRHRARASGAVPAGPDTQRPRLPRPRGGPQPPPQQRAHRLYLRLPRPRPLRSPIPTGTTTP